METGQVSAPDNSNSEIVIPLKENGKQTGQWTFTLFPSHIALADAPGAQPYIILRDEAVKPGFFHEGLRLVEVKKPRKILFRMTAGGADAFADWIGKPLLAARYLKQRYAWISMFAILWALSCFGSLIPPATGKAAPSLDITYFLLGVFLFASTAFAKWRPHPILFLVDALWFLSVAVNLAITVVYGRSKWWLIAVILLVWVAIKGFRHFGRFRGINIPRST